MEKQKILIVDDDPDLKKGLNLRLRANHYDTVYASDGFSAVMMAQKERPNLIILDIGLPDGSGFAVTKAEIRCEGKLVCNSEITFRLVEFPNAEFRANMEKMAAILEFPASAFGWRTLLVASPQRYSVQSRSRSSPALLRKSCR